MKSLLRWMGLVAFAALALELFFVLRIATMAVLNPESTTFQRSEAWAQITGDGTLRWRQQWVPYAQISSHLKRAVIASEDDGFVNHEGVDWNAIEKAWERNAKAEAQTAKAQTRAPAKVVRAPKIRGGSTITQQLAKNLLLSGERTLVRKGQEFVLTLALEQFLSKERILEIYLNNVEWGNGIFGAEAAARHYFRKSAAQLAPHEAARLAVMLPAPKRFEKMPNSAYLSGRTRTILGRMGSAELP
ncbi:MULTISPECIES: monofunctional biosynthetic peptidoglycan transglycosylase [unclassified Simplicispira]|jgi:monofunctional biosynthetic peptidoglycan transglycosylase|uniref:monofunctional biosynthetic peptidoglycan transglycosylase n=1 Tax=unclassified Simplicispira TaxID=2630407 RepID=UPI000D5D148D|nr:MULTISPECIES: monofunctional biosynthetic peptidoglycan transglycosylase [unclassified Simplicispira]MBH1979150.1 monofunctional biosynthetic peptidoglycan transglycosylase [Comamonadaceae bacterium]PVY58332.1 monofunctional biosynthetic peptidoglycan transglycosylase [Simplicispira sp. 125]REG15698.1 monofunctional biosynthetic peptidoglycan transglycosylase [Simplicispira sp. 110]